MSDTELITDIDNQLPAVQVVKLQYFKGTGKYYSEGEFFVPASISLLDIWELVKEKQKNKTLPGIMGSEWYIHCCAPGHKHDHPRLFMPVI